jgi:hypothetical protein
VVGTWTVAGSCLNVGEVVNMSSFGLGCSEAPISGTMEVSGSMTFNADGTFTDMTTTTGAAEILLPGSCLEVSGTVTQCTAIGSPLTSAGFATVDCVDAGPEPLTDGCTCAATLDQAAGPAFPSIDVKADGSYTTADTTLTASYFTDVEYSYCVAANILTMTPLTVGKTGTASGEIVLQK